MQDCGVKSGAVVLQLKPLGFHGFPQSKAALFLPFLGHVCPLCDQPNARHAVCLCSVPLVHADPDRRTLWGGGGGLVVTKQTFNFSCCFLGRLQIPLEAFWSGLQGPVL